ncbi:MAG: glycosyltransferase [Fibromonadaceae bacterium]|nr:glycosyltransferase [Fibromonadaceae bacterium]
MIVILVFLALIYLCLMLYLWTGLLKTSHLPLTSHLPHVSIVIPMRNEEPFIETTLNALNAQKYDGKWEVIVVNDRSTDKSPEIVQNFCEKNEKFSMLNVPHDSPQIASPKKRALNTGFLAAKGEFLLIADADCVPPPNWLNSMANCYAGGASVVQGAKANNGGGSFLHAYQKLETLGWTLIEAAGFNRNKPLVASAASLGYSKDLFFKCGGFEGLYDIASGDDDMLIHRMAKIKETKFAYNWDTSSIMPTAPVDSWKALLQQRARWGSNGAKYDNKAYSIFLFCIYAFFVWLFISPFLCLLGMPVYYALIPFLIKIICDFALLFTGALRLKSLKLLWCLPLVEIVQVPLFVAAVPLGMLGMYRWK